jgi:hypothetical protein
MVNPERTQVMSGSLGHVEFGGLKEFFGGEVGIEHDRSQDGQGYEGVKVHGQLPDCKLIFDLLR